MAVDESYKHPTQGVVKSEIERPQKETIDIFRRLYTAFVADHIGKCGIMDPAIKGLIEGAKICGPAVTVQGADLTVRRMAIDISEPGDVLVVAAGGITNRSCFGDGTALRMSRKHLSGVVIDGMTRDRDGIVRLGFPTFCLGVTPRNYHYPEEGNMGGVNVPVVCGGVVVNPGDLIIGDGDGVVVMERTLADSLAGEMLKNYEAECQQRDAMTCFSPFGVKETMLDRGYRFA